MNINFIKDLGIETPPAKEPHQINLCRWGRDFVDFNQNKLN